MSFFNFSGFSPVSWFFWVLLLGAFIVELIAFVDAVRRPAGAFTAAGKQTKQLWLIILGVSLVIGIGGVLNYVTALNLLAIAAFVAAAIYLTDVKPKIQNLRGGSRQGPYGPW